MRLLTVALAALFTLGLVFDAEARRLGGARNIGQQRQAISPQQAAPKAPAQQPAATGTNPAQQPAAAGSRWLGPLAGFALGAGLFALFLNNGVPGVLAGLLLLGLILAGALYLARAVRSRTGTAPLQYAGATAPGASTPLAGGSTPVAMQTASGWPADFDAAEFVRHARLNFVRLQEAHDRKDLSALREFLAPQVYREIEADIQAAGTATQHTEVVTLNADVLEVAEEAGNYIVSVRFSGLIREAQDAGPEEFTETWHLQKPVSGRSGWVVAGIQQG